MIRRTALAINRVNDITLPKGSTILSVKRFDGQPFLFYRFEERVETETIQVSVVATGTHLDKDIDAEYIDSIKIGGRFFHCFVSRTDSPETPKLQFSSVVTLGVRKPTGSAYLVECYFQPEFAASRTLVAEFSVPYDRADDIKLAWSTGHIRIPLLLECIAKVKAARLEN